MQMFLSSIVFLEILFVVFCVVNSVCGRRFPEEGYFPSPEEGGYYDRRQELVNKVKAALTQLEQAPSPQLSPDWPDANVKLGQVSGVALDGAGRLLVFHRGAHVWDERTFTQRHVYQFIGDPAITNPTVLVFNDTGDLLDAWGEHLFYMPHGITVDSVGNVWLTDVALHQVFKFTPDQRQKPALVLGEKFVPGSDDAHFCKPSAVAVLASGDFFVADGYCNTRIVKFAPDGTRILQWGHRSGESQFVFDVPHALTLAEDRGLVCVADRERGRAACYRADNGTYVTGFRHWLVGPRMFSVAYTPVQGGRLYVVNGPTATGDVPVRGYVIDFESSRLLQTFAPEGDFTNPHDVVVSPDGSKVYVAEISPYRVYKFVDEQLLNASRMTSGAASSAASSAASGAASGAARAKPTATVELSGTRDPGAVGAEAGPSGWDTWRGAAGGASGAAGAALLALAALMLLKARNRGRKGLTRRRWEYGHGEFKFRQLLERRRFTRVHSEDSDEEPAPMLPPQPANA